jgi:NADH-quinone oxidoreductase subunit N
MTLAMVSLAGIPPLAGFIGKFMILKAAVEAGGAYYALLGVAIVGVVISIWYYFGVVRAIYWDKAPEDASPMNISAPTVGALAFCALGMIYLGVMPGSPLDAAGRAIQALF